MAPATKPETTFHGINHIKLPALSVERTSNFYTTIFPFTPMPQFDRRLTPQREFFVKVFKHEQSNVLIEVRHAPAQARAQEGWDPISYGVGTKADLEKWEKWFDANDVRHSPIYTGFKTWVMSCEDPDGRFVRLFVEDEEHEWTENPSRDRYWLGGVEADPDF